MTLNLTSDGLNVMLRALAGIDIVFTKIKLGNGAEQTLDVVSEIANPLLEVGISEIVVTNSNAILSTTFNNSTLDVGFRMTEVGVFCQDPLDDTQEVLYAYGYEPEDTADYIASSSGEVRETELDFLVFIGNSENVSAIINESAVYASKAEFIAHTDDTSNPHSVTKDQVGLGNVPNVGTNDQTPTYSPAATPAHLLSGEKLSAAFAKIAAAVSSLISHIANRNNPHNVKAEQVGAAKAAHTHSTADITSGTLSVGRGGTGRNAYRANQILYATSAKDIGQIANPTKQNQFLTQGTSGAPKFAYVQSAKVGTYIGSGSDDLKFNFANRPAPKILMIISATSTGEMYVSIPSFSFGICIGGQNAGPISGWSVELQESEGFYLVSMSLDGSAITKINANGTTYYYVAVF